MGKLSLLGKDLHKQKPGPVINTKLAELFTTVYRNGLEKEKKEEIIKENVPALKAHILNSEVGFAVKRVYRKKITIKSSYKIY